MSHRYLILGLLAESPMSGYDIKKQVNSALAAATNASYGTLYPTLHKLLAEGAVEMQEVAQQGRPSKKIYQITEQGRQELLEWLKQPTAADQVRREFLLKLYLARSLGAQEVVALLQARRDQAENAQKALLKEKRAAETEAAAWVADYALTLCQTEIEWLKRVENQIGIARA